MTKQLSTQAQAAKMIRASLKANGISAKVTSESASMMTAVRVEILGDVLPATKKAVEAYANQFQYGHFDGMQDLYEYSNRNADLPQVKYVTVTATYSDEIKQEVLTYLCANYADFANVPTTLAEVKYYTQAGSESVHTWIHRVLAGVEAVEFWSTRKPRVQVAA
jgi:hypothetical protein